MKTLLLTCVITLGLGIAFTVMAAAEGPITYEPVVKLPYLDADSSSTQEYVNALYMLAIMVAALLAVVKIIFGGVKWMFSDVVTDKSAAKKDIWGAILGLLIVLAAVIVLETINPNLAKLKFLNNAPGITDVFKDEDTVRDELRDKYKGVGDTYTGPMNTPEHFAFISACRADGGWPVLKAASSDTVECRIKK
jgi:hypothetical protein